MYLLCGLRQTPLYFCCLMEIQVIIIILRYIFFPLIKVSVSFKTMGKLQFSASYLNIKQNQSCFVQFLRWRQPILPFAFSMLMGIGSGSHLVLSIGRPAEVRLSLYRLLKEGMSLSCCKWF